jgi:hypothetical protein
MLWILYGWIERGEALMSKNGLVLFLFFVLIAFIGLSIHGTIREHTAFHQLEAENQELKEAIGKIYERSLSVRISMELGMSEVARQLWKEKLDPAIQDALVLCREE